MRTVSSLRALSPFGTRGERRPPSSKAPNRKCTKSSEASCWKRPSADRPPVTSAVQQTKIMRGQGLFAASDLHRVCNQTPKSEMSNTAALRRCRVWEGMQQEQGQRQCRTSVGSTHARCAWEMSRYQKRATDNALEPLLCLLPSSCCDCLHALRSSAHQLYWKPCIPFPLAAALCLGCPETSKECICLSVAPDKGLPRPKRQTGGQNQRQGE